MLGRFVRLGLMVLAGPVLYYKSWRMGSDFADLETGSAGAIYHHQSNSTSSTNFPIEHMVTGHLNHSKTELSDIYPTVYDMRAAARRIDSITGRGWWTVQ